jgi:hypothetical protein
MGFRNKIAGFDYSSKYFEIVNNNDMLVMNIKEFLDCN